MKLVKISCKHENSDYIMSLKNRKGGKKQWQIVKLLKEHYAQAY